MSELIEFARKHRFRVRNLHDGRPTWPLRVPVNGRGRADGYRGGERMDAIIGRRGYIVDAGEGRIGWFMKSASNKGVRQWLKSLTRVGVVAEQVGEAEAAGTAPVRAIGAILRILRPYRLHGVNLGSTWPGMPPLRTRMAHRIEATAVPRG